MTEAEEVPLSGDWAPELLDGILSSPNPEARDAMLRAGFAAGPAIVPQLEAGLKDDRTAEFAAQSLALMGGEKALDILSKLVSDPRDLNLKRFFFSALGEYDSPQATQTLLDVIKGSDKEPDRTVTEAAVLALTVRSDPSLVPRLREAEAKLKDVVIRDDLDNAAAVIESRARYLASVAGKNAGGSVEQAVRTYFMPALEPPEPPKPQAASAAPSRAEGGPPTPAKSSGASSASTKPTVKPASQAKPRTSGATGVDVQIQSLVFSPDKTRALARVIFEDPSALANYDIVLQKRYGNWTLASVWLGAEVEKTPPRSEPAPSEP